MSPLQSPHAPGPIAHFAASTRDRLTHRRATVRELLESPLGSPAAFETTWGHLALLRLPPPEMIARALLERAAQATTHQKPSGALAERALTMLRAFRTMEVDVFGGERGFVLIGRGREVDLHLDEPSVSKRHALLHSTEEGAFIEDLESFNGTWVNEERVTGTRLLQEGDLVKTGDVHWAFVSASTLFLQLESVRHAGAHS